MIRTTVVGSWPLPEMYRERLLQYHRGTLPEMLIKPTLAGAAEIAIREQKATGITRDKFDLFEMANPSPALTGLPMVVWVPERGRARHDVRIEVHMAHGRQMSIGNTATVAARPTPRPFTSWSASS